MLRLARSLVILLAWWGSREDIGHDWETMRLLPSGQQLTEVAERAIDSAVNLWDLYLGEGVVDLTPMPSSIVFEEPQCSLRRYRRRSHEDVSDRPQPSRPTGSATRRKGRRGRSPSASSRGRRDPVLLGPPLAAPASCFDLRRGVSVAEHLVERGYPTYLVDYGPISFGDRGLGLEHWIDEVLPAAVAATHDDAGAASGC